MHLGRRPFLFGKKTVRWHFPNQLRESFRQRRRPPGNPIRRHLQEPLGLRIDDLHRSIGGYNQHATRQIFQYPRQIRAHPRVLLQAPLQLGVCTLQFPMQTRHFSLQLGTGFLQRSRSLRERQKRARQALLRRGPRFALHTAGRSLPGPRNFWHHRFLCTLSARLVAPGLDFS